MATATATPDYGLDAPRRVRMYFSRGAWTLGFALVLFYINRVEYPGPAALFAGVVALIGVGFLAAGALMVRFSRTVKLQLREQMLDSLAIDGSEKVLDVGCGRGLLGIGAAKRLHKGGKVTAIDTWDPQRVSGNSLEAARENAKLENIGEKIRFETGDAKKLVYPDSHYDLVLSSLALHTLADGEEREQALREMFRVLKPSGKLLIHDVLYASDYAATLRAAGAKDVALSGTSFLWCLPARTLTARK